MIINDTPHDDVSHAAVRRWLVRLALLAILLLGAFFRSQSLLSWDEPSFRLHPDERFFSDVASTLQVPKDLAEYLDSKRNPLNPRNYQKSTWYVYGLLPQLVTQYTAVMLTPNSTLQPCITPPDNIDPGVRVGRPCSDTSVGDADGKIANNDLGVPKLLPLQLLLNPKGEDMTEFYHIYMVGRVWSTLFDLGSIVLAFLIGARLYRRRVGLLAALFMACAALPIQLSHFFTVDAATAFFVLLTIYWGVRSAQGGRWGSFAMLGVSIGLAMACRVTMAALGLVGVAAVAVQLWGTTQPWRGDTVAFDARLSISLRKMAELLGMLALAGVVSVLSFRMFQPDAFVGTNFLDLRLEPRFVENMQRISASVSGEADSPPSVQWAGRVPYLFALQNIVLWGMGLPLGVAAWLGWAAAGWRLVRRGRLAHLVPWVWVAFYFAWQGGLFGPTMRYYSSMYGLLSVFAAWGLWALVAKAGPALRGAGARRMRPYLARGALVLVAVGTLLWAYAFTRIYTRPHSRIEASRWIFQNIPAGSTISAEEWDDGLPLTLDGQSSMQYNVISMKPYLEDEQSKYFSSTNQQGVVQPGLLDQLDQLDYIVLSSNRVYDSTKRQPMRYPYLMRYYSSLFSGELGFELVADVHSYPTLFGIEIPTPVLAEEAFSVYDHPRVLIFKKTPVYSRAHAEQLITKGAVWDEVYKVGSLVAHRVPTALRLTDAQWEGYRSFNISLVPSWLGNALPWLVWLVVLELLGLAAFALLFHALPNLPDRGFALSKTLGLLGVAWLAWMLASLGADDGRPLMSFSPSSLWFCALLLIIPGALVGWFSRRPLLDFARERRTALISAEALFLVAFFGFLALRAINPDLWHDARGGEKPMDLAFLTATLKSAAFPPYDPWFAGGYINYYYFGFVFVGALVHLTGVAPTVAYNLAIPTVFALTALGAFGVAYNLLARPRRAPNPARPPRREAGPIVTGLVAALFVVCFGPLTQAAWMLPGTADKADTTLSEECLAKSSYAAQQDCRGRKEWAFWDATRVVSIAIHQRTGEGDSTINEFPFFTFLFGDLHAHMIALVFALAALGLMVALLRNADASPFRHSWRFRPPHPTLRGVVVLLFPLVGLALAVGALSATNTWDYPTYLGLGVLTLGLAGWRRWQRGAALLRELLLWGALALALAVLARLLFLPFHQHFATDYAGFEQYTGTRTGALEFVKLHGIWLLLMLGGALAYYQRRRKAPALALGAGALAALAYVAAVVALNLPVFLLVVLPLGVAVGLVLDLLFRARDEGEPAASFAAIMPGVWFSTALALCFASEIIVAKGDIGRMNTVFKLGMQSWVLFALPAAFSFVSLWKRVPRQLAELRAGRAQPARLALGWLGRAAAALAVLLGMAYPLTATPARLADRFDDSIAPTLDGIAYMASPKAHWSENGHDFTFQEDAAALDWMRRNISGTPIVLEAQAEGYRWAGRVSIYTGLPTLLGWPWHETQQRSVAQAGTALNSRKALIQQLYTDPSEVTTLNLLRSYGVEYVYYGQLEQALYDTVGLAKFERMVAAGDLAQVYSQGSTHIYRVLNPLPPVELTTTLQVNAPPSTSTKDAMLTQPVNELPAVGEYAWNSLAKSQPVAVLLWLLAWAALVALGLPLSVLAFGRWRDGGLGLAPLVGLLALAWAVWLPVSAGLWQYNRLGMLLGALVVLAADAGALAALNKIAGGTWSARGGLAALGQHLRAHRRGAAWAGGLFLAAFAAMAGIRALNPDLWQPIWGGEKPFEFGYLNAILRSPVMPPYNPFYSGGTINYYYYGLYLVSLPIKATGIAPAVGFNLAIATLFALHVLGAFTLVRQLTGRARYGLLGALFTSVASNLTSVIVVPGASSKGLAAVADAFQRGLPNFGIHLDDWFIGPSRVIPYTINEFPLWSFLFADLHPHLIALPIALLAMALSLSFLQWRDQGSEERRLRLGGAAALLALTLGAQAVTNSWDFPTYALLAAGALAGAAWLDRRAWGWALVRRMALAGLGALTLALAALLLYLPFFQNYQAMVGGVGLVVRAGTPPASYAAIYGLFLAVLLPALFAGLGRAAQATLARRYAARVRGRGAPPNAELWKGLVPLALSALAGAGVLAAAVLSQSDLALKLALGAAMLGFAGLLTRRLSTAVWFALLLAALGFAVSLGVELVYIRDHLAGDPANPGDWYRMNTVFKFGMQIWSLFAVASAALLPALMRWLRQLPLRVSVAMVLGGAATLLIAVGSAVLPSGTPLPGGAAAWPLIQLAYSAVFCALLLPLLLYFRLRIADILFPSVITVLALLALVYPLFGIPSRVAYRFPVTPGPTLDGLAFMDEGIFEWNGNVISLKDDADAIRWLNEGGSIRGTPVVLQASLEFYRSYGVRVAANTGLPTVVGPAHEGEQRDGGLVGARDADVGGFYSTTSIDQALRFLSKYKVGYVYVGQIERLYYGEAGMAKFGQLAGSYLTQVYRNDTVTIYKVDEGIFGLPSTPANPGDVISTSPQAAQPQPTVAPVDLEAIANPPGKPTLAELEAQNQADPTSASAAYNLGERYRSLGRLDDAARVLGAAAQANPGDVPLHHMWGDTLRDSGHQDEAVAAYTEAAQAKPEAGNYNKLGRELLDMGRLEAAESALLEATRLDATLADPNYFLGELYARQDKRDQARDAYLRYLDLAPSGDLAERARAGLKKVQ